MIQPRGCARRARHGTLCNVPAHPELYSGDIKSVLFSEQDIATRTAELAAAIAAGGVIAIKIANNANNVPEP